MLPIEQRLRADSVASHHDQRHFQHRSGGNQAHRVTLARRQQGIGPLFALQARDECRCVEYHRSVRQAVFIVAQLLLVGARIEHRQLAQPLLHAMHARRQRVRAGAA